MGADETDADLDLAHRLADTGARTALRHFGPAVPTELKVDGSIDDDLGDDIDGHERFTWSAVSS